MVYITICPMLKLSTIISIIFLNLIGLVVNIKLLTNRIIPMIMIIKG